MQYRPAIHLRCEAHTFRLHREGVFVNRKMNYERMATVTRAYLESIGMKELALHAAPVLAPATDEQILIGQI